MSTQSASSRRLLYELNAWTPMAEVIQGMVAEFLDGPTTLLVADSDNHLLRALPLKAFRGCTPLLHVGSRGHQGGRTELPLFVSPWSLAVHKPTGSVLVGELGGCVRRVNANGETSTLCGKPGEKGYREGASTNARFHSVSGALVVGADLIVSDLGNHCLRRVPLDGSCSSLFAGQPQQEGFEDSPSAMNYPGGLTADGEGNVFVTDQGNHSIRKVTSTGKVTTLAGCGERGHRDGVGREARFNYPSDCVYDKEDSLVVTDCFNHCLRRVEIKTGRVSTLAGQPGVSEHKDGDASTAAFVSPQSLTIDHATGDIYVSCSNHTVRRLSPEGTVTTIFGLPGEPGHEEGKLHWPTGLALV